jgi:transcriptional regulator with XRE-family HTH domain
LTVAKERPKSQLTDFGAALYALLLPRGMRSMAELADRLEEQGHPMSRQTLAAYANGTRRVPPSLARKVSETLDLDYDERVRLAMGIAFGQPDEKPRPRKG